MYKYRYGIYLDGIVVVLYILKNILSLSWFSGYRFSGYRYCIFSQAWDWESVETVFRSKWTIQITTREKIIKMRELDINIRDNYGIT